MANTLQCHFKNKLANENTVSEEKWLHQNFLSRCEIWCPIMQMRSQILLWANKSDLKASYCQDGYLGVFIHLAD